MRAYLIVALLLLIIFGGISGYLYRQFSALGASDFTPPPVTITAATASMASWDSTVSAIGTVRAAQGVELSAEASGEVIAIDVDSGDQVTKGQLLVTLNDSVERASRENQVASLKLAKLLFERDEQLIKQKSIPQSQYDRSQADLERAVAQLAETDAILNNKRIQAPFAGTIGIIQARVGTYLEPGDAITTLQDLSSLEVDFTVQARYYPQLEQGQLITVRVEAYPDQVFRARLQAVDAKVDPETRNLLLRAVLEPGSKLLPGMFAQLQLNLGSTRTLVTIPETAVSYSLHGNTVYILETGDEGLVARPQVVQTGPSRDGRIAITAGLEAGQRVASSGQNKLGQETRVIVDETVELEGL